MIKACAVSICVMARCFAGLINPQSFRNFSLPEVVERFLHTSSALCKVQAGKVKITQNRDKPVTYEEACTPPRIAQIKSWNSWNTSTIEGGLGHSAMAIDDLFIRKFMQGTFPDSLLSKVIIKRQYNIIRIAAIVKNYPIPSRMGFLIGYTEELLSYWFQCIVKLELQVVSDPKSIIFKYV